MPAGVELLPCWPETTLGNIRGSARDDDIDYTILALELIERHGSSLRTQDIAEEWLSRLPFLQTFTAERATYRNLVNGVPVDTAGQELNPYREWIGAQIRGDMFGYVHAGNPRAAAVAAWSDAVLSHRGNGIYGEMWVAAMVAAAFTSAGPLAAIAESLHHIPPRSRLHEALQFVVGLHLEGQSWESAVSHIRERFGRYHAVHTINNAALVAAGLLWGAGDFTQSICLTVCGGWDTDSNGATAGSVAGVLVGLGNLPAKWTEPLENQVRSTLSGCDGTAITELAERTLRVAVQHGQPY
jgi:ADP-ribosylglycohydrolase